MFEATSHFLEADQMFNWNGLDPQQEPPRGIRSAKQGPQMFGHSAREMERSCWITLSYQTKHSLPERACVCMPTACWTCAPLKQHCSKMMPHSAFAVANSTGSSQSSSQHSLQCVPKTTHLCVSFGVHITLPRCARNNLQA